MTRFAAAALAIALTGCTSYADRVANTCTRLGAPQGSAEYWPCVQQQIATDQADRAMWAGVAVSGFALAAQPAPVACTTMGSVTTCR